MSRSILKSSSRLNDCKVIFLSKNMMSLREGALLILIAEGAVEWDIVPFLSYLL